MTWAIPEPKWQALGQTRRTFTIVPRRASCTALPLALLVSWGVAARGVAGQDSAATPPLGVVSPDQTPRYSVGVDYHAYGTDFQHTAFITILPTERARRRKTVQAQLQGMADRGATTISTKIWLVTEPGTTDFGESWRTTFPMIDREAGNLRTYAGDVAAVRGVAGNRLRLDVEVLLAGRRGLPARLAVAPAWGTLKISAAEFTSRLQTTTGRSGLAALSGVNRPDGVPVVNQRPERRGHASATRPTRSGS